MAQRGDIVTVSRALSALVNVQDDQGVLVGNWSCKSSSLSLSLPPFHSFNIASILTLCSKLRWRYITIRMDWIRRYSQAISITLIIILSIIIIIIIINDKD